MLVLEALYNLAVLSWANYLYSLNLIFLFYILKKLYKVSGSQPFLWQNFIDYFQPPPSLYTM